MAKDVGRFREAERRLWESVGVAPTERFVELPTLGARVRVLEHGEGPTALFVHGAAGGGPTWAELVARLDGVRCVLLDRPGGDFEGGEFILTEQKPRSQSRAQVVPLDRGDAVVFAVNERPAPGRRGYYRLKMRHGVSEIRSGRRHMLGIIFHDAA